MKTLETIGNRPQDERYPYGVFATGDRVSLPGYTDVRPGTVVDVKRNGTEIHVRCDNYKLAEGQKPEMIPGGFAAHCTNQDELVYDITENLEGAVRAFTLRKWHGRYVWTTKGVSPDGRMSVHHGWSAFYDYNF